MSSQFARRLLVDAGAFDDEKSGARNGFDIWYCFTDCGMTWRSSTTGLTGASVTTIRSSGLSSPPASMSMARRISSAAGVSGALSVSNWMSVVSRAAVFAMIVAIPSSRVSSLTRSASLSSLSPLIRARSSRTSTATTRNRVRLAGLTLPRSAEFSIARTVRASTGMTPASSWCWRRRCCCGAPRRDPWRVPALPDLVLRPGVAMLLLGWRTDPPPAVWMLPQSENHGELEALLASQNPALPVGEVHVRV